MVYNRDESAGFRTVRNRSEWHLFFAGYKGRVPYGYKGYRVCGISVLKTKKFLDRNFLTSIPF